MKIRAKRRKIQTPKNERGLIGAFRRSGGGIPGPGRTYKPNFPAACKIAAVREDGIQGVGRRSLLRRTSGFRPSTIYELWGWRPPPVNFSKTSKCWRRCNPNHSRADSTGPKSFIVLSFPGRLQNTKCQRKNLRIGLRY